jgi:serine/threonine protein kinase
MPTEEGTLLGSPRYLSPEQASGVSAGPRSDLYSAGAVLYLMVVGRDPFHHREGIAAVLHAQRRETPRPPSSVAPQSIPEALDQLVLRAMSKRPDDRFPSAQAFSDALDGALVYADDTRDAVTEPVNVSAFRGAMRDREDDREAARTEPLDISMFRGALRRAPLPDPTASTLPPARIAPKAATPWPTTRQAPSSPTPVRRSHGQPLAVMLLFAAVILAACVACALMLFRHGR